MDADTLRLILFVGGVALILAIYLIGKKRSQSTTRVHATKHEEELDSEFEEEIEPVDEYEDVDELDDDFPEEEDQTHDPLFRDEAFEQDAQLEDPELPPVPSERVEPRFSALDEDNDPPARSSAVKALFPDRLKEDEPIEEPQLVQTTFAFAATDEEADEKMFDSIAPDDDAPVKIIQLILAAKSDTPIKGDALKKACDELDLQLGDMDIYHYQVETPSNKKRVAFSMASMVEPGTFPKTKLSEFETPGVVMFAQLPGPKDGLAIFSDMLFSAERMAALLDLELQDGTHSTLTKQVIEHMREEILEHRRQVQLARSKR